MWRPRPSRSSEERLTAPNSSCQDTGKVFFLPKKQKIQLLAATQLFSSSGSPTEIQGRICGLEVLRIGQKQEKSTTCNPMAAQALPGLDLESDTIIENK